MGGETGQKKVKGLKEHICITHQQTQQCSVVGVGGGGQRDGGRVICNSISSKIKMLRHNFKYFC